jgi:hypothetical protein
MRRWVSRVLKITNMVTTKACASACEENPVFIISFQVTPAFTASTCETSLPSFGRFDWAAAHRHGSAGNNLLSGGSWTRARGAGSLSALSPGTRSQQATFKLFVGDGVGLVVF